MAVDPLLEAELRFLVEFRALMEALVDRIVIGPPIPPANAFNPARVEIVWR